MIIMIMIDPDRSSIIMMMVPACMCIRDVYTRTSADHHDHDHPMGTRTVYVYVYMYTYTYTCMYTRTAGGARTIMIMIIPSCS